jgi:D-alanine--poly(phosphoribitol) ligase subunit 2
MASSATRSVALRENAKRHSRNDIPTGEDRALTDADFRQKLRSYIEERFLVTFDADFPENSDLFREGVMDSFGYIQLHRFIESEFGIAFTDSELAQGVLASLTQIQDYVSRRLRAQTDARNIPGA